MNRRQGSRPRTGLQPYSGLALLRKPSGITSFQALAPLKRRLGTERIGHAGTLDRFAHGLLVVLVGPYSRLSSYASAGEKTYRGLVRFGAETATLDPEGAVVAEAPPPSREGLESALHNFRGQISQRPPAYSAVHVDGKRAYKRALAGEEPALRERPVVIRELLLESYDGRDALLSVVCSAGTYIRSLARDIALACDSRAYLAELERLSIGPFRVEEAVDPETFEPDRDLAPLDPVSAARLGLRTLVVDCDQVSRFLNGAALSVTAFKPIGAGQEHDSCKNSPAAVYDPGGLLLGVVELREGKIVYRAVLGGAP